MAYALVILPLITGIIPGPVVAIRRMAGSNIQSAQFRGAHGYEAQIPIFGNQIKAARALAGFDQRTLAERSGVGVNTIRSMEAAGAANVRGLARTLRKRK